MTNAKEALEWYERKDAAEAAQELEPCPFCGGDAIPPNERDHHVSCSKCGASGANWAEYDSAVEAWNTRYNAMTDDYSIDDVKAPRHYRGDGEIEAKRAMKSMMYAVKIQADIGGWWMAAFKYLWRWPHKGWIKDLKKCRECLDNMIEEVEAL